MMLSPVAPPSSFSANSRPGAVLDLRPSPGCTTMPCAAIATSCAVYRSPIILAERRPGRIGFMRQPQEVALDAGEAAETAHLGAHLAGDAARLPDADLARGNGAANPLHCLLKIRCIVQQSDADPEMLGRVAGAGRRQQRRQKRPEQPGLAVEQRRDGLWVSPVRLNGQDAPLRARDAARPALEIAGMAVGEAPA